VEGNIELVKAVDHFDYRSGEKFSAFAFLRILRRIKQAIGSG
jgi:DNA-directed RNA polymerase sigma subunit (sigma70/sigma32)